MLCLQEVQEDHYRTEIKSSLESLGMMKLLGPMHRPLVVGVTCYLWGVQSFGNSVLVSSKILSLYIIESSLLLSLATMLCILFYEFIKCSLEATFKFFTSVPVG